MVTFTKASVAIHGEKSVVFSFAALRSFLPDAFMSAKYFLSPGKFLTLTFAGYGNDSETTVPFMRSRYLRSVASVNVPGLPPSGIFALSCVIAPISCVATLSLWEINTASGFSRWTSAMYGA